MKARHFWDVWICAVDRVASVRSGLGVHCLNGDIIRREIGERHGGAIAEEAVAYYERLRADTQRLSSGAT